MHSDPDEGKRSGKEGYQAQMQARNARLEKIATMLQSARCPRCGGRPLVRSPQLLLRDPRHRLTCAACFSLWTAPPISD